jgi:hypothetical protein
LHAGDFEDDAADLEAELADDRAGSTTSRTST